MNTALGKFLRSDRQSVAREKLVESAFLYDMKLAAAKCGYGLIVSRTETDTDGYDLVLDDRLTTIPIQLKSAVGKAGAWPIHRRLLRPNLAALSTYGLHSSSHHAGNAGAIVVVLLNPLLQNQVVQYLVSDYMILESFRAKTLPASQRHRSIAERTRLDLLDSPKGTVKYPRAAFVHAPSPDALLALLGLSSLLSNGWRNSLMLYPQCRSRQHPLGSNEAEEEEFYRTQATEELGAVLRA